jgi:hypothetical protein
MIMTEIATKLLRTYTASGGHAQPAQRCWRSQNSIDNETLYSMVKIQDAVFTQAAV